MKATRPVSATRLTTTLRIERGHRVPAEGETVIMQRELSGRLTAVTVHRVTARREHPSEPGVWLLDARVTMRDIATEEHARGVQP